MPPRPDGPLGSLDASARARLQALVADVQCPRCRTPIAAADLDLQRRLATCSRCDTRFDYHRPESQVPPKPSTPIAKPRGISIRREEPDVDILGPRGAGLAKGRLILTRRWFGWEALFVLVFAIIWNAIVVFMARVESGLPVPPFPFGIFGVLSAYVALTFLVNRTTLILDPRRLTITHGPLPWPGKRELETDMIDQVYCEREFAGKKNQNSGIALSVRLRTGEKLRLMGSFGRLEHARFIEQEIEGYYEIADRQVQGEYRSGKS